MPHANIRQSGVSWGPWNPGKWMRHLLLSVAFGSRARGLVQSLRLTLGRNSVTSTKARHTHTHAKGHPETQKHAWTQHTEKTHTHTHAL